MELFKTYHTCRFSTLTINFSKVWSTQILELGKQFNLMIHLQNILKASLQDVLKMSWRRFCRRLEDVLKTSWRRFGKMSWRCLEDVFARRFDDVLNTFLQDVLKMSSKRLEDFLKTYSQDGYIGLDQDVLKTSWRHLLKTKDVFKTSSSRRMFAGQFETRHLSFYDNFDKNVSVQQFTKTKQKIKALNYGTLLKLIEP